MSDHEFWCCGSHVNGVCQIESEGAMPEETKPRVFNPPDRIYLQVVGTDEKADIAEVYSKPFDHFAEISWCSDKINDSDLEYRLVRRSNGKS